MKKYKIDFSLYFQTETNFLTIKLVGLKFSQMIDRHRETYLYGCIEKPLICSSYFGSRFVQELVFLSGTSIAHFLFSPLEGATE